LSYNHRSTKIRITNLIRIVDLSIRWDTRKANDGGVVNDAEARAFFKAQLSPAATQLPTHFTFALHNPATFQVRCVP
jgi:hypothetical protein